MAAVLNEIYRLFGDATYLVLMGMVFLAVALMVGGLVLLVLQRDPLRARMSKFVPATQAAGGGRGVLLKDEEGSTLVKKISEPIYKAVAPQEEGEQKKDRLLLIQAGFRSKTAYRTYMVVRFVCLILFPLGFLFTAFFYKLSAPALIAGLGISAIGFFLPSLVVGFLAGRRKQEIARALPDALDLMVVCVESGLGLDMTFKRVGEEVRPLSKALSDEFYLTTSEIRAGKARSESFRAMGTRTGVQEVNNLMTILVQSSRFGTSMAKALRVHADAMRVKRRQLAEEKAAKVSVKLVFPLIFFIFPALMIVIGGPAFIRIYRVLLPSLSGGG
ncbi:type II secretion system F family protein [Geoalkalibacter sp.]|uniref:type II secretion system F family protein n=1 Tax=Geoalkalibacter sp. TaxID=3041440 RepID=UPI00272E0CAA|nr:type II secretion system F family protein [Geoalkalibacter sp.]